LNDSPRQPRFIRTVHGFGYAFCAEAATPRWWVLCDGDVFPLRPGENIVGRGSDADVRLDRAGVSRRHARLIVQDDGVVIEDAGSKNGTFVAGTRIEEPRKLTRNDEFAVGPVHARLQNAPPDAATETIDHP
jgi:predicted component of type VI protein secretion system